MPAERRALFRHLPAPSGTFSDTVPYGRYILSAFPPATRQGLALAASTRYLHGGGEQPLRYSRRHISLRVLQPLPGDVSLNGYDGGVPE